MPTRNVVLTDHQERFIARLVDSGRYQNASEVLREGLRLIEAREAAQTARLDALRHAIEFAGQQAETGGVAELRLDDILDEPGEEGGGGQG